MGNILREGMSGQPFYRFFFLFSHYFNFNHQNALVWGNSYVICA